MKIKSLTLFVAAVATMAVTATVKAQNMPNHFPLRAPQNGPRKIVPVPTDGWDSTRIYHQAVILYSFSDTTFSMPVPQEYYTRMLNEHGYNEGIGPGSAADYLLDQSHGKFHVVFDVYGPFQLSGKAKSSAGMNYGTINMISAASQFYNAYPDMDYSIYDWDGDGIIEQLLFIAAGPGGDEGNSGFTWPNTGEASYVYDTPDNLSVQRVSLTVERFARVASGIRGFATLIHEYAHCLGLPDIYNTNSQATDYIIADDWDIMDGGNYIDKGFCPPNLTAFEQMAMHWLEPVELSSDTTITDLRPVAEGGEAYLIRHTENEYLILENRQQSGWDYGIPGKGLTIWHIDMDTLSWKYNIINSGNHPRVEFIYADNLSHSEWKKRVRSAERFTMEPFMRSLWLSSAAYPWATDSTDFVNDRLTPDSSPALVMYNPNGQGSYSLGKSITNIQMAADGTISFTLVSDDPSPATDISSPYSSGEGTKPARKILRNGQLYILTAGEMYDITGRKVRPVE